MEQARFYARRMNGMKYYREKAELTQAKVVELTDYAVTQGMISAHERGKKHITDHSKLKAIATVLNCRVVDIANLGDKVDPLECLEIAELGILASIDSQRKRKKVAQLLDMIRTELTEE